MSPRNGRVKRSRVKSKEVHTQYSFCLCMYVSLSCSSISFFLISKPAFFTNQLFIQGGSSSSVSHPCSEINDSPLILIPNSQEKITDWHGLGQTSPPGSLGCYFNYKVFWQFNNPDLHLKKVGLPQFTRLALNHTTVKQKIPDLYLCLLMSNLMLIPLYYHRFFSIYICGALYNLQCVFISSISFDPSSNLHFIVLILQSKKKKFMLTEAR